MRRLLPALLCVVVAAAVASAVIAATGDRSEQPESAAPPKREAAAALSGAPAPLAALHDQSNQLLDGGAEAFRKRLAGLKGYPVVVNMWGSWCDPCRAEFPYFQKQSVERGKEIGFIGVDANDNDADAAKFLERFPVSFPSFKDPDLEVSARIKAVAAFPSTAFYDSKGELVHVKQGGYSSEEKLVADIRRYAR